MYLVNRIDEICSFSPPGSVEISLFEKKVETCSEALKKGYS